MSILFSPFWLFTLNLRVNFFRDGLAMFALGTMAWAVGSAVVGAGATAYGANKASKAQKSANDANIAAQQAANRQAYQQWLMTRGVGANGEAVNTRLPLWAMAKTPIGQPKAQRRFRRRSTSMAQLAPPADAGYALQPGLPLY